MVVLGYAADTPLTLESIEAVLQGHLAKFKWPKAVVKVEPWPINSLGKLDRKKLSLTAQQHYSQAQQ